MSCLSLSIVSWPGMKPFGILDTMPVFHGTVFDKRASADSTACCICWGGVYIIMVVG